MTAIHLDIAVFRALFPAFSNATTYPDIRIEAMWDQATAYISDQTGGCYCGGMTLKQQTYALNLMTAHLLAIGDIIAAGSTPGVVQGATIDKVSVTLTPPPIKTQWNWWLNQTPYGQQLLALFNVASVGGIYVPAGGCMGISELSAFRKVGGRF